MSKVDNELTADLTRSLVEARDEAFTKRLFRMMDMRQSALRIGRIVLIAASVASMALALEGFRRVALSMAALFSPP